MTCRISSARVTRVERLLGGLVGVERPLVVLACGLVERRRQHVGVEPLQLLAEAGDVLVGDLAHRLEVGDLPLLSALRWLPWVTERATSTTAPMTSSTMIGVMT